MLAQVQLARGENDAALATAKAIVEQDGQDSYRLEYALMKLQAGQEEEGRKDLNALTGSETTAAVAERALADMDFQLGNRDAAAQRYSNLVSSGRFVYESLFYLGAIAESRDGLGRSSPDLQSCDGRRPRHGRAIARRTHQGTARRDSTPV